MRRARYNINLSVPMKEEEKKATNSTSGFIEVVSKHDITKGEMLLRRVTERQILVAFLRAHNPDERE